MKLTCEYCGCKTDKLFAAEHPTIIKEIQVCEECESSCTDCGTFKNSDEIYGGMYLFDKDSTDGEITPKLYSSDDFLCMPCINKKQKQEV